MKRSTKPAKPPAPARPVAESEALRPTLVRLRALATRELERGAGNSNDVGLLLVANLQPGEQASLRHAHGLLLKEAIYCLEFCGYLDDWRAEILDGLKELAHEGGWLFEDREWIPDPTHPLNQKGR